MIFVPKSYIETAEGFLCAVTAEVFENGKVRCFVRYVRNENGDWRKVQSDEANLLLSKNYSDYFFHSVEFDAHLHAVSVNKIVKFFFFKQKTAYEIHR